MLTVAAIAGGHASAEFQCYILYMCYIIIICFKVIIEVLPKNSKRPYPSFNVFHALSQILF